MSRLTDALAPGTSVYVPGFSGESGLLFEELEADPDRARDVDFVGVQYPGIGRADYASLHPAARQTGFFMSPAIRHGLADGRARLLSLDYAGIVRHLRESPPFDAVFVQLSSPDTEGWCSPGVCADFPPIVWRRARRRVAHINPRMPRTRSSFRVHVSEIDIAVERDAPLVAFTEPTVSDAEKRIGQLVAGIVRDGDTVQFGVGSVPTALIGALASHRRLRIYTGMVSSSIKGLCEAGALDAPVPVTTGSAVGTPEFYEYIRRFPELFWFTDASRTHDVSLLATLPRFVAVNSATEVDLLGQVNGERADGALVSGPGGLPVFARAASLADGGRFLICLKSTARGGTVSRIVPSLGANALCTIPGHLADTVVTEHGVAQVRGLSIDARARALVRIAAPQHREALERAWFDIWARLR